MFLALAACVDEASIGEPTSTPALQAALSTDAGVVALGEALFFDQRLSLNGNQSCASCKSAAWGWTGPSSATNQHAAVYEGSIGGAFGDRKTTQLRLRDTEPRAPL